MTVRTLLLCAILLGTGLTGCLRGGDEPAPAVDVVDPEINRQNPNGNATLVAFEETNATESGVGGVDHHHDLWNGQSRIVLFDEAFAFSPFPDDQNRAAIEFQVPQGKLVFEGTGSIEFTISKPQRHACPSPATFNDEFLCTDNAARIASDFAGAPAPPADGAPPADDPAPPAGLKLQFKHASTTTWIDAGDLAWDTPLALKITDPLQTDMPHATSSLWTFQITSPNAHDTTLSFHAKVELVRGEIGIPLWPGHPDFYAERATREVLNVPEAQSCDGSAGCALATGETTPLVASKLISYGTKSLHVWLNITESNFPNPATAPQNWFLFHDNATGRTNVTNPFDAEATVDVKEFYWIFPVDDNAMDSPYADGSRWTFGLGGSLTTPLVSCYSNCADWFAKYTIVAHATNVVLPFEEYTYYCLRDAECPAPSG